MNASLAKQGGAPSRSALAGPAKGLLFLISLDEAIATRVLAHLAPEEVRRLRSAAEMLKEVDPTELVGVHREFIDIVQKGVPASLKGSGAYLRRLVGKAHGEGAAAELWSEQRGTEGVMAALSNLDVSTILGILEREHEQTIAVILSQLPPQKASDVRGRMASERQADVLMRLARLESVPVSIIDEIDQQFASELEMLGADIRTPIKGMESASDVLKRIDGERAEALMEEISAVDTMMAEELQQSLFTFEDLMRVDARGMQMLLKEISSEQLVLALKTASDEIKEQVFGSVSSRAAKVLHEELDLLGPVRVAEVEEAQKAVVSQALELEREGKINIAREGGGDYV